MKKRLISYHQIINLILFISLLLPVSLIAQSSDRDLTTIILIRHAEADGNSSDPNLTDEGYHRAEKLAEMFSHVPFDAVYSTEFQRTQETAAPIAELNNLDIQLYDYRNPSSQVEKWLEMHDGDTVLVSGHSNTTPTFANEILGEDHFDENFDESDYGNILVITISDNEKKLLHLRY